MQESEGSLTSNVVIEPPLCILHRISSEVIFQFFNNPFEISNQNFKTCIKGDTFLFLTTLILISFSAFVQASRG